MAQSICSTIGCDRAVAYAARKLCRKCYKRATYTRTSNKARLSTPDVERFEARVVAGENGCWQWVGSANRVRDGYGVFSAQGRKHVYAHRWSYEYHIDHIPDELEIDHLCRNTLCVNPWHLEPVTPKVNQRRIPRVPKTHCIHGHERTPENVLRSGACRACTYAAAAKSRRENPKPVAAFCKNGHPMSGSNLVEKSGIRVCRACRSLAAKAANAKRWGADRTHQPLE